MKLKFAIFAILASTMCLLGLLYTFMNHTDVATKKDNPKEVKPKTATGLGQPENKNNYAPQEERKINHSPDNESDQNNSDAMSDQDIKYIEKISSLNPEELSKELDSLKQQIENTDLISQLENKQLDSKQTQEAKATLERFAILGLEATRRKYENIEPELKDAVLAHRDSLREIREMLSEY